MTKQKQSQSAAPAKAAEAEDPGIKKLAEAARATYATPKEAEAEVKAQQELLRRQDEMVRKAHINRHAGE